MGEMMRLLDERHTSANQKRLHSALNDTTEKRYFNLLNNYPEPIQRFPQHIIASYLGFNRKHSVVFAAAPSKK